MNTVESSCSDKNMQISRNYKIKKRARQGLPFDFFFSCFSLKVVMFNLPAFYLDSINKFYPRMFNLPGFSLDNLHKFYLYVQFTNLPFEYAPFST